MAILDVKIRRRQYDQANKEAKKWEERDTRLMKKLQNSQANSSTTITDVAESSGVKQQQQQQIMDVKLLEAAKNGDVDNFITCLEKFSHHTNCSPLSTISTQLTDPEQNTFLHVAASYGHHNLTTYIAYEFSQLLACRNHRGDSALHLATRAGHYGVVNVLLRVGKVLEKNQIRKDDLLTSYHLGTHEKKNEALYRKRDEETLAINDDGNTALHESMLHNHYSLVLCLIKSNVEAAYYVNKQGKSPLYMAVESGKVEYVRIIFTGRSDEYMHLLDDQLVFTGRSDEYMHLFDDQLVKGKSLLHAAIRRKSIAIVREIAINKPMLIHVKDEDGLSPPDFASSIGFLEAVNFLQDWLKEETIGTDAVGVNPDFLKNTRMIRNKRIMQSVMLERRNEKVQRLIIEMPPEDSTQLGGDRPMSLDLYMYAKEGLIDSVLSFFSSEFCPPVSDIYDQKTPLQNTIIHVAASFGNEDFTRFIVQHFPSFLGMKNHKGDTALHVAAAAGHLGVVKILLGFQTDQMRIDSVVDVDIESNNETLIGKFIERVQVNDEGNTPLHEALMHNHGKVTEYLIKEKIEDAYYVNKRGKSALYMAIEANNIDYVQAILSTRISNAYRRILYKEVIKGKSLVHAAITSKNIVLLREIINMDTAIRHITDENGQTPLHYAASTNFAEGVKFFLLNHKMHITEKDADGFFPIHCASKYGHVGILVELLHNCLDAREFVNQDGQNILHVAAKYGKSCVVKYILRTPGLELLLNEKDKKGNTPLHLAARNWHPKIVSCLTWDKRVDLKLVNNQNLTALEVSEENMEGITTYRQRLTWTALKSAGAERAKVSKKPKFERLKSSVIEPFNMDHWKDRVNTLLLVSTLIATVTFAAGFTMPGGYNDSEPYQGMGILLNKLPFQAFVICDTIAMYSAILVTVTLIWAQLGDITLVINSLRLAVPLLGISLTMMSLAFMAAVYVVISKLVWLSYVVLILGLISLACLLTLFIPFNLPHSSNNPVARYLSYYSFCLLMLASGCYFDPDVDYN